MHRRRSYFAPAPKSFLRRRPAMRRSGPIGTAPTSSWMVGTTGTSSARLRRQASSRRGVMPKARPLAARCRTEPAGRGPAAGSSALVPPIGRTSAGAREVARRAVVRSSVCYLPQAAVTVCFCKKNIRRYGNNKEFLSMAFFPRPDLRTTQTFKLI